MSHHLLPVIMTVPVLIHRIAHVSNGGSSVRNTAAAQVLAEIDFQVAVRPASRAVNLSHVCAYDCAVFVIQRSVAVMMTTSTVPIGDWKSGENLFALEDPTFTDLVCLPERRSILIPI